MTRTDEALKTKYIDGKLYKLAGADLRAEELADLKREGYSVRSFYNHKYREAYTYILAKGK